MRTSQLVACTFAGFGVYLIVTTLVSGVASVAAFAYFMRLGSDDTWPIMALQALIPILPLVVGGVFLFCSSAIGRIVIRFAQVTDSEIAVHLPPLVFVRGILIGMGAFVLVAYIPKVIQTAFLIFQTRAGSREVSFEAGQNLPGTPELITALMTVALGFVLCFRSLPLAQKIMKEERQA